MSYRLIRDKDEEQAKECLNLDCRKTFYFGEKCPFCTVILTPCETCGKIKIDEKWIFPLEAMFKVIVAKKMHFDISNGTVTCPTCKAKTTRLILQRAGALLSQDCVFV